MGNCIFRLGHETFRALCPKFNFDYMPTTERFCLRGKIVCCGLSIKYFPFIYVYVSFFCFSVCFFAAHSGRGSVNCAILNYFHVFSALNYGKETSTRRRVPQLQPGSGFSIFALFGHCSPSLSRSLFLSLSLAVGLQYCISFVLLCGLSGWSREFVGNSNLLLRKLNCCESA